MRVHDCDVLDSRKSLREIFYKSNRVRVSITVSNSPSPLVFRRGYENTGKVLY